MKNVKKLFLDCEYNGFGGGLISMAIVDCDGNEFSGTTTFFQAVVIRSKENH